ncbi:hypothetical protein PV396_27220 [Streptomyces sp. ME02-8801-2C]|uniref:hypothetical protein n=1 Tax=Streptomyces sp. ME02-8801-2C TaxID=3028680 RepID=UPI0029AF6EC3|nr:hypothetical protein [Streptomyces sp. ME02-8801-2C]MDX3455584.1 hypothetical protein [Streptomyces sp. ME02-8801-2C]
MTQSGQGEEPSPRVAREGIVLPSDGGEPLLPGMTGGSGGRPAPTPAAPPPPAPNPAGGQTWGQPWGPDSDEARHPGQAQAAEGWPTPPDAQQHQQQHHQQQWGPEGQFHPHSNPHANPYSTPQPQAQQQPEQQAPSAPAWDNDPRVSGGWSQQPGYGAESAPLPPAAGGAPMPQYQQQYGQQYGGAPLPPEGGAAVPYAAASGAPLPPADDGATQYIPPVPGNSGPVADPATQYFPPHAPAPGPAAPHVNEAATQYIPPVPGNAGPVGDPATQYLPPVAPHAPAPGPAAPHVNEAATQFLPPVGPGALPPEAQAEATTYLGRVPQAAPAGSDADATQYIPPVPGGSYGIPAGGADGRQPPSDFDNLFRTGPGSDAPAGSTQQLPRVQPQQPHQYQQPAPAPSYGQQAPYGAQQPPYGFPGQPHDMDDRHDGRGGRRSRVPVIAALGIGIVVLGIGAGALLSGGGGDSDTEAGNKTVAATSGAPEESKAPAADPAKAQAVELDKLLADSNNSRDAVIKAVADVKSCRNLGQAASDLRGAAQQRGELVTRLSALDVDKLPEHDQLTDALTKAWHASQSADDHYAAWADQVAGKNGCKKGQARTTGQTQKGNQQSGIATAQKAKAAELWNAIAQPYGLTERQSTQL